MDTTSRRPQLPALSYLDVSNVKRKEDMYQSNNTSATQQHTDVPIKSQAEPYTSAPPPPPYNHPSHQHASPWAPINREHTPPASRRTSREDHEDVRQQASQTLPSISEAVGRGILGNQMTHTTPSTLAQVPTSLAAHAPQPTTPRSPSAARRSYTMEPPASQPNYTSFRQDSAGPQQPSSIDHHATYSAPPPQPLRTQPSSHAFPPSPSPKIEQPHATPAGSLPPVQPSTFAYGYAPYPPRYAQPAVQGNPAPIHPASTHAVDPSTPSTTWKSDSASSRYPDERPAPAAYSASVKRHLDMYDLEASLTDIGQTSSHMMDFSRRYGDRMHQNARGAPALPNLPSIVEVEDMMQKARMQLDSLSKIREVILTEKAVYEQQMADQYQRQRHEPFSEAHASQHSDLYQDESKAGFANGETKKRRGRAAPPGRCHSCNRAETPEWRRGPDGARTLCNACGLHYAKLTRKQTTSGKAGSATGSSNLRPKEG